MIGMFDSGHGGLSVWRTLTAQLPDEPVIYLADQGYCPYGGRSEAEIIARAVVITDYLLAQGATLLLVACNTATSAAVSHLRAQYPDLPIVGMEPAIKPAALSTQSGKIGVLATQATLRGEKYRQLAAQLSSHAEIFSQAGLGFVEQVEAADLDSPQTREIVRQALSPLLAQDVDHIVLGCTHYPFLSPLIRSLLPEHIDIIDPSDAVVRQTLRLLTPERRSGPQHPASYRFITTGSSDSMQDFLQQILQRQNAVEAITL